MRKEEFVTEYESNTDNSKQIFSELTKAGYQYVGGGQDATIWGRDEGEVLKVIMPSDKKAHAERSFLMFHDACIALGDDPHVPKFVDQHSVFEINGVDYMQISMEKLYPIKDYFDELMVWRLSDMAGRVGWGDWAKILYALEHEDESGDGEDQFIIDTLSKDPKGSQNKYQPFFKTMTYFRKISATNGLGWDLHTENVMCRKDGTLVITDPFFT